MKDLKSNILTTLVTPGTTIIDKQGYESLTFSFSIEDGVTITMTEGDDAALSDGAAVDAAFLIGKKTFVTADGSVATIGYNGDKRYVQFDYGTGPTTEVCQAIQGHAHLSPTGQA